MPFVRVTRNRSRSLHVNLLAKAEWGKSQFDKRMCGIFGEGSSDKSIAKQINQASSNIILISFGFHGFWLGRNVIKRPFSDSERLHQIIPTTTTWIKHPGLCSFEVKREQHEIHSHEQRPQRQNGWEKGSRRPIFLFSCYYESGEKLYACWGNDQWCKTYSFGAKFNFHDAQNKNE